MSTKVCTLSDKRITESSGIANGVKFPDLFYTINDEPTSPSIFAVETKSGKTVGTANIGKWVPADSEAIAVSSHGNITLADIGDNELKRKYISIGIIPEFGRKNAGQVKGSVFKLKYPNGPHNAETLLIHPLTGEKFIVTKGTKARVYRLPTKLSKLTTTKLIDTGVVLNAAYVTDGTFSADGKYVLLRLKGSQKIIVYKFSNWKVETEFTVSKVIKGESLTLEPSGTTVLTGSEGVNSPIYRTYLPKEILPQGSQPPAPAPVKVPSKVLDLTNWKITLPTGAGTTPKEVKQPELDTFVDAKYFHANAAEDGVIFQAHCGGVTTSNSGYPRSELREMRGSSLASWSNKTGQHNLSLTQAITHLPVNKPHVVAAQIHDAEDDVVMVRLEGKRLFVESGGDDIGLLDLAYKLGDKFTIQIFASSLGIDISYNNLETQTSATVQIEGKTGEGWYFKAGCYTQSNTHNKSPWNSDLASAYGEVVIYSLELTHS